MNSNNKIHKKEFEEVANLVFDSFLIQASTDQYVLESQGFLISSFVDTLNKYLELQTPGDKKRKLTVINFIDKLNLQKELIDLQKGVTNINDIKQAAQRFGRKSQSALSTE